MKHVRLWVPEHWWQSFVTIWKKIGQEFVARCSPQTRQWWNTFTKNWKKIGNAYSNRNKPPDNLPGCERFILPNHAPLTPIQAPSPAPSPAIDLTPDVVLRSCGGKNRYHTEAYAKNVATSCWYDRGDDLRVYACDICGGWHLTRRRAAAVMQENWRPPRLSERHLNMQRKREKRRR